MTFKVELLKLDQISEQERGWYGNYHKYATFLRVSYNGELLYLECDKMEPEDTIFCRDLSWVPKVIRHAYELGLQDGKNEQSSNKTS